MAVKTSPLLSELDPFDILDTEAGRLDHYFASLDEAGWARPSRCDGWSVRDVLAHLAGEELYNHACLDGDLMPLRMLLEREGVEGGYNGFNEWCVRKRRDKPVEDVLAEWRQKSGETRRRMRELGRDATLQTSVGPYPVGLQAYHFDSEFATHADDVGAPVSPEERRDRTLWRVQVGLFALGESGSKAQVDTSGDRVRVQAAGLEADLTPEDFVEATVGRLPIGHPVDQDVRNALRCLA